LQAFLVRFWCSFEEQLEHRHPLYILSKVIHWQTFEESFLKHYSDEGRFAKPYRKV